MLLFTVVKEVEAQILEQPLKAKLTQRPKEWYRSPTVRFRASTNSSKPSGKVYFSKADYAITKQLISADASKAVSKVGPQTEV